MKKLWIEADSLIKSGNVDAAIPLLRRAIREEARRRSGASFWPSKELAKIYRKQHNYKLEHETLERFLSNYRERAERLGLSSEVWWQREMRERAEKAAELANAQSIGVIDQSGRGECEACEKKDRVLTHIESGHWVCTTCLREIRGPARPKHLASIKQIEFLHSCGYTVSDDTTKERADFLGEVEYARHQGLDVDENATPDELDRALASCVKTILTKVAGMRHRNADGSDRQAYASSCAVGEVVQLIREPGNIHDPRAVKVCRASGQQIGYLRSDVVGNDQGIGWCLADRMDDGVTIDATIKELQRGHDGLRDVLLEVTFRPFATGGTGQVNQQTQ